MTGSTTNGAIACSRTFIDTTSMIAADESMPVFVAAISKSSKTASIWASIKSVGKSKDAVTAVVFCAVTAVSTEVAKTPLACIALMSAWTPAPPPESDPAMVKPTFM